MARSSTKNGFTLVELLVVVTIMGIVAGILMSGFLNYARYQSYRATVSQVEYLLHQTQSYAKTARYDEHHGIVFDSNRIIQFYGNNYDVLDANNIVTNFDNVSFTTALTDGVTEIRLNKVTGLPNATGTISVVGISHNDTVTFEITSAGVIQYE